MGTKILFILVNKNDTKIEAFFEFKMTYEKF